MPAPTSIAKADKALFVRDETKRPMSIMRLRHHPTAPRLLAQTVDRMLAVWDLTAAPTAAPGRDRNAGPAVAGIRHCAHDAGWIRGFDVSADGRWVLTGGSDRRLRLWNWADGVPAEKPLFEIAPAHDGWVEAVAFSPDGSLAATVGADRRIRIRDAADLKLVRQSAEGHSGIIRDVVWSRDGRTLFTGGEDGKVVVWDAARLSPLRIVEFGETNEQQGQHPQVSGVHRLAISRDGRWVAAAGDRRLSLIDADKGEPAAAGDAAGRLQAAFHPQHDLIAAGGDTVKVWLYDAGKFTGSSPPATAPKGKAVGRAVGNLGKEIGSVKLGDFSLGLSFSPDGGSLALGKSNGGVELWNIG